MEKDIEQVHICLGFPGFPGDTEEQFALLVLNNALGGSMSSRLFQKIREEHGMAYSVYSYPTSYSDTGYFTLYAGTGEKQAAKVVELMLREIDSVKKDGITKEEFARSKQQLKGNYLLGLESTASRSSSLGRGELEEGYTPMRSLFAVLRALRWKVSKTSFQEYWTQKGWREHSLAG